MQSTFWFCFLLPDSCWFVLGTYVIFISFFFFFFFFFHFLFLISGLFKLNFAVPWMWMAFLLFLHLLKFLNEEVSLANYNFSTPYVFHLSLEDGREEEIRQWNFSFHSIYPFESYKESRGRVDWVSTWVCSGSIFWTCPLGIWLKKITVCCLSQ